LEVRGETDIVLRLRIAARMDKPIHIHIEDVDEGVDALALGSVRL